MGAASIFTGLGRALALVFLLFVTLQLTEENPICVDS